MKDASISIERTSADPTLYSVIVRDGRGETRHEVTVAGARAEVRDGRASAEEVIDAAFRFLLDREPKESILRRFDSR